MTTDWSAIRAAYAAGASPFNLALEHAVPAREIQLRARAEGWGLTPPEPDPVAAIRTRHRADAARLRELLNRQLSSLERLSSGRPEDIQPGDLSVLSTGRGGNTQGTVDATARAADAMAKVFALERQAHEIDRDDVMPTPEAVRQTLEAVKAELARRQGSG